MDVSQVTSNASLTSGVQATGGGHRHHHHKSISDQVNQMGSAIDSAVQAGTMTSDQATALKKELADITQTLQGAQASATTGTTGSTSSAATTSTTSQTNPLSQLSDADRKKVFSELQDVRKQLFAALNPQDADATSATSASASSSGSDAISNLFTQIDTNGNGSIDQSEFTQFLAQIGANALGYNQQGTASAATSALAGSNFSVLA